MAASIGKALNPSDYITGHSGRHDKRPQKIHRQPDLMRRSAELLGLQDVECEDDEEGDGE